MTEQNNNETPATWGGFNCHGMILHKYHAGRITHLVGCDKTVDNQRMYLATLSADQSGTLTEVRIYAEGKLIMTASVFGGINVAMLMAVGAIDRYHGLRIRRVNKRKNKSRRAANAIKANITTDEISALKEVTE